MGFELRDKFAELGFLENKLYEFYFPVLTFDSFGNPIINYRIGQFSSIIFYGVL